MLSIIALYEPSDIHYFYYISGRRKKKNITTISEYFMHVWKKELYHIILNLQNATKNSVVSTSIQTRMQLLVAIPPHHCAMDSTGLVARLTEFKGTKYYLSRRLDACLESDILRIITYTNHKCIYSAWSVKKA